MADNPHPQPPDPPQRPHTVRSPHGDREDEYYWMRDDSRSSPEIIAHLDAENAYAEAVLAPYAEQREVLYAELIARIKPDDASVPVQEGDWWYSLRFLPGAEYPQYVRRHGQQGEDQILVDANVEADGHDYYSVGALEVSPDGRFLAFTEDTLSRRQYTLRVRDLATGIDLPDRIGGVEPAIAWADDGTTLVFIEQDPVTLLGIRVRAHRLGDDPADARLLFANDDVAFYLSVRRGRSGRYLYVDLDSTDTTETLAAPAGDLALAFAAVVPRSEGHEYHVDDLDGTFVIRTNLAAPNFKIVRVPIGVSADPAQWREVVAHDPDVFIDSALVLRDHLVLNVRDGGLLRLRTIPWSGGDGFTVASDDPASSMFIGPHREQDTTRLRYVYSSLTTPSSDMEVDLTTGSRILLKRAYAGEDFDPARYTSDHLHATAADGTSIPVSLMRRVDTPLDGTAPLLQYAYGAYGISTDPHFRASWLSLADRGFVLAIAHVRGGQELGRRWYEDGRQGHKRNTFTDFIDVTRHLVASKVASPDAVFAAGGSAGGLLMGAIANMAPGDYRGIIAQVPFVDVVTTMLDPTIPLTTNEYEEWGNPVEVDAYTNILGYSPYDNVTAQAYPAMLVLTGLHDSQVQYWEPAKWVARLRRIGTGHAPILFVTRMEAGHGGASGRYRAHEDTALIYAFILSRLDAPVG